jgi:hypothetical protein
VTFRKICFCGEVLFAPLPTPKLEDHSLSAVHDLLFNIFTANLHIWRPFPPSSIRRGEVCVCHGPENLCWR